MSTQAIADYALLSDCHGSALVHRSGSIDWLALPRFDSPALCARLLGPSAGHWKLAPAGQSHQIQRRYAKGTMVLETIFQTQEGEVLIRDALALGAGQGGHALGKDAPHLVLREAQCTHGSVELELEYAPRPEYGLIAPILRLVEGGALAHGGASVLFLSSPVRLQVDQSTARSRFQISSGERIAFALEHRTSVESPPHAWAGDAISARIQDTMDAWCSWSDMHRNYQGPWQDLVQHSGRVLQALTFYPTGAIIAAATTSLPEAIGGGRNWDYRYTWVRDASLTLDALWIAACPDEGYKFFDFIAQAALNQIQTGQDMQIMFGIGGEHDLSERIVTHLPGWRASSPVRVGNDAWRQRQFDTYGSILAAAERLKEQLAQHLDPTTKTFLAEVADMAADRWMQPDHGLWEVRDIPRDYLHSKLMCWVALDRAIKLSNLLDAQRRLRHWQTVRGQIREAILEQGWSEQQRSYVQAFGSTELDAAALVMPLVGFLPATDSRMRSTMDAIEEDLTDERGLVHRYRSADGLEGEEGSFLLCTFWLAHARALAGQVGRAREIFERASAYVNDVGLFSEEVDSATGELLGNFPQAFSHIGLINAAWAIDQAQRKQSEPHTATG